MNEELASLKENETCELVNRPVNANGVQNSWVMCVKMSRDGNARFKAQLYVKGYAQNKELFTKQHYSRSTPRHRPHTTCGARLKKIYEAAIVRCGKRLLLR